MEGIWFRSPPFLLAWMLGSTSCSTGSSTTTEEGREILLAMLLLTLRGTPTVYYGEEIGMEDVPLPPQRPILLAGAAQTPRAALPPMALSYAASRPAPPAGPR